MSKKTKQPETASAQPENVRENGPCPNQSAGCKGTLRYYDGCLGYEALRCDACAYELDLNAEANAKATTERETASASQNREEVPRHFYENSWPSEEDKPAHTRKFML